MRLIDIIKESLYIAGKDRQKDAALQLKEEIMLLLNHIHSDVKNDNISDAWEGAHALVDMLRQYNQMEGGKHFHSKNY